MVNDSVISIVNLFFITKNGKCKIYTYIKGHLSSREWRRPKKLCLNGKEENVDDDTFQVVFECVKRFLMKKWPKLTEVIS